MKVKCIHGYWKLSKNNTYRQILSLKELPDKGKVYEVETKTKMLVDFDFKFKNAIYKEFFTLKGFPRTCQFAADHFKIVEA